MTLPESFNGSITTLHYYQGVLIAEVALTLIFYLLLKIIHYVKWGYDGEMAGGDKKADVAKEGEDTDSESKVRDGLVRSGTRRLGTCTSPSSSPTTSEPSHSSSSTSPTSTPQSSDSSTSWPSSPSSSSTSASRTPSQEMAAGPRALESSGEVNFGICSYVLLQHYAHHWRTFRSLEGLCFLIWIEIISHLLIRRPA